MRRLLSSIGLAPYGGDELFIALIFAGASAAALRLVHPALALLPLAPLAIVLWFFRDPNRSGTQDREILLAPADGTVNDIIEVDETDYIQGRALRIGIFLSPLNVHVNRVPCAGQVQYINYKAGEFLPAYNPEAPTRNESVTMGLATDFGRVIVKQITGILARRIICEAQIGESLTRGERYGMIKFGSRTELYVPLSLGAAALVKVGDKVRGGETPICKITSGLIPPPQTGMMVEIPVSVDASGERERSEPPRVMGH